MSENSEYMAAIGGLHISVNKDGGGTLGRAYEGNWTITVRNGPEYVYDNDTLHTGTPKTHAEVARTAFIFASAKIDEA